jgi:radical SAM superfamily enzyme YgiQ (UPF0313 family)
MDKGTLVEQFAIARENLRNEGIRACYFLQFGYPGENWEDIQKTVEMVRATRPDDIGVSVSYPLPGTKFFERVKMQIGEKSNWSDSEDLSMMFQGAYTHCDWVLIDVGDVVVHLFRPEVRGYYNIEKIWSVDSAHLGHAH